MLASRLSAAVCAVYTLGGLLLAGCGSTSSSGGNSGGASSAGVGSGGSSSGASGSSFGGSSAGTLSSGGSSAGTLSNGGSSAGTAAGGASNGCHTAADCPAGNLALGSFGPAQCLPPGQSPPQQQVCGALGWCGQCACPLMPTGNGQPCQTNADCPAAGASLPSASVCAMGKCSQCSVSADCPAQTPVCGFAGGIGPQVRLCSACLADTDCPSAVPHCASSFGQTRCVSCLTSTQCAVGVCTDGACMPECGPDKPCANPLTECSANQRCEALSCATSATCPPNTACDSGHCQRRHCAQDSECDQGRCVDSSCYESLGTCYTQMAVP